ncbi:MAG: putative ribonucleotide transport ATP-binding protein mkl [Chlamydiales bacterium]|nr:putative ribonucleotide transport ATP-binding protein mkl [Chlamydiales bacterium]
MIEVENLWKSYNGTTVLKGLDLKVETGETLVILGQSGCGKSVLLRQILGLERPDKGRVSVDGVCISELKESKLYMAIREMGMLFQAAALFDSLTVGENTAFYLRQHNHHSEKEIQDLVAEALHMVGLGGKEEAMPSDLSGGMRKRAALARLIVYRPKLLLYDEPTTGLDPITAMQINDLILKTQRELNATSIVVTHDICSAFHVADRIALNHGGKIVYIATKSEFVKIEDPLVQTFLKNSIPNGDLFNG